MPQGPIARHFQKPAGYSEVFFWRFWRSAWSRASCSDRASRRAADRGVPRLFDMANVLASQYAERHRIRAQANGNVLQDISLTRMILGRL